MQIFQKLLGYFQRQCDLQDQVWDHALISLARANFVESRVLSFGRSYTLPCDNSSWLRVHQLITIAATQASFNQQEMVLLTLSSPAPKEIN